MSYKKCCKVLKEKYGKINENYFDEDAFINGKCKKNTRITRGKEGLFIHHIDEDKAILLSTPRYALKNPYHYHLGKRLVYCNLLEHLILHIKIMEKPHPKRNKNELVGIGGADGFIIPELNDIYSGINYTNWKKAVINAVIDYEDIYLEILNYFINKAKFHKMYKLNDKNKRCLKLLTSFDYNLEHDANNNIPLWKKIINFLPQDNSINVNLDEIAKRQNQLKAFMKNDFKSLLENLTKCTK